MLPSPPMVTWRMIRDIDHRIIFVCWLLHDNFEGLFCSSDGKASRLLITLVRHALGHSAFEVTGEDAPVPNPFRFRPNPLADMACLLAVDKHVVMMWGVFVLLPIELRHIWFVIALGRFS